MELKQGDRVVVYRDPITRTRPEGVATVTFAHGHELYAVAFDGDDGATVVRLVLPPWGVCAWCKSFFNSQHELIRTCTADEYAVTQSHGICRCCKTEQTLKPKTEGV